MSLAALLGLRPGVTAIIGGGGKTTLMETLGRELASKARVILTTSTKIRRPDWLPVLDPETPEALGQALEAAPAVPGRSLARKQAVEPFPALFGPGVVGGLRPGGGGRLQGPARQGPR